VAAPHRSCLSVPGSARRMLAKAAELAADEIVIDLEDAVAVAAKDDARALVVDCLRGTDWNERYVSVRVNAVGTPWCHLDLLALAELERGPDSVVVPKVESAADLAFVERLLDGAEAGNGNRSAPIGVQALVESAAGLGRVSEIAACEGRLEALVLGYADLAASLGRDTDAEPAVWDSAREALLLAARAHGLRAIDGPYLGTGADERLLTSAQRGKAAGFDGKWAIHPSQLQILNEVFSPSPAEVEWARSVIAALGEAEARGAGAVELDGRMLDEALRAAALRLLDRAETSAGPGS
jgi:citrate lyase subunit beta / citryl-CoA lyase